MKTKRRAIIVLAMLMIVMGLVLTGCSDRDNTSPTEITTPSRPGGLERPASPDTVPPELRHPDGTIG